MGHKLTVRERAEKFAKGQKPSLRLATSTQPRRPPSGRRIVCDMQDHLKAGRRGERFILGGRQARVVQRIAAVFADDFAVMRSGVEHQPGTAGRVVGEDSEHPPLVVRVEVKEAIPSKDAVEAPTKR
ncbi:hypothetical protein [Bradyrhizobium liaoningense]|uniref:hypothetical protein n=1 Tax=Bradyrhizobium liaoningense TaxID=43992 RepID=UPI002011BD33|nr:hypothetical protein [Bradyrhizobium liaoningense]